MKNINKDEDNYENLNINESIEYNNIRQSIVGGIDPDRLINKEYLSSLGDFYKCNICFKIMIKPTDCEECGHSYCQECISKLKCPFGCKNKSLKNTSIGIFNLLKNLKFNCPNEGCDEIIPYIDVKEHDINCEYQKILCPNKRCKKKIIKKELENHIKNICKYTLIKCKYCFTEYYRKEINEHEKLCCLTYQYLKNYNNNKENNIKITESFSINEKNFNKYIQSLSVNISKILKENNNFNNNTNTIKENKDNKDIKDIKDKNNENKKITNKNDNNQINTNKEDNKQIKNKNVDNNKNNNIKNYNDESKQSLAQIEEDDLVDIIKKALDERLTERLANYEFNFNQFFQDMNVIKGCVCKLNTIEEVKESEEEDNEEENENEINNKSLSKEIKSSNNEKENNINNNNLDISNKKNNINNKENKEIIKDDKIYNLKNIRNDLKDLVDTIEINIKNSIIQLNISLLNLKMNKNENNGDIHNNYSCSSENDEKIKLEIINKNIEDFSNKIINCIKDMKIKINNVNEKLNAKNEKILIISENNDNNLDISKNNNIIEEIKNVLQKILNKNNKEFLNKENKEILLNNKKENIIENKDININKDLNINKSEINKLFDTGFKSMNKEINEVNKELESIKEVIQNVKNLILNQFNDFSKKININNDDKKYKNLIREISFHFFNNNKKYYNSGIKSVKTIRSQNLKNTNNTLNSNIKKQKLKKKFNSTNTNLIEIYPIKEIECIENHNRSNSSNSLLYFYGSDINNNILEKKDKNKDKDNLIIDNDILEKLLNLEKKIKNIYEYMELIPDIVKEKMNNELSQNMIKMKDKVNNNLDEKIKNIFSLKFCEECEKVEYFYGFKKCSNCANDSCKNCIMLCQNCKNFLCKNCFQKNHQCEKIVSI